MYIELRQMFPKGYRPYYTCTLYKNKLEKIKGFKAYKYWDALRQLIDWAESTGLDIDNVKIKKSKMIYERANK